MTEPSICILPSRVRSNYVSFKVNSRVLNATEVAQQIKANQERLEELTGVQITSVGLGNRVCIISCITKFNLTLSC